MMLSREIFYYGDHSMTPEVYLSALYSGIYIDRPIDST